MNILKIKKIRLILSLFSISTLCFTQSNWIQITNNKAEDFHTSFSPDGKKILFDSEQSGHNEIYLYDVSTKKTNQLTNGLSKNDHPSWYPDGKHILFTSWEKGPELYKLNIENSHKEKLAESGFGIPSPKGDKVAFLTNKAGNYDLYVMDNDGINQIQLTTNKGMMLAYLGRRTEKILHSCQT